MTNQVPVPGKDIQRLLRHVNTEIRQMLLVAHAQGFRVRRTGSGHLQVKTPEHWREQKMTVVPRTPSEYRAVANARQKLRQAGVKLPR